MLKIYYDNTRAIVSDEDTKTYKGMRKESAIAISKSIHSRNFYEEDLAQKTSYLKEIGYEERK